MSLFKEKRKKEKEFCRIRFCLYILTQDDSFLGNLIGLAIKLIIKRYFHFRLARKEVFFQLNIEGFNPAENFVKMGDLLGVRVKTGFMDKNQINAFPAAMHYQGEKHFRKKRIQDFACLLDILDSANLIAKVMGDIVYDYAFEIIGKTHILRGCKFFEGGRQLGILRACIPGQYKNFLKTF